MVDQHQIQGGNLKLDRSRDKLDFLQEFYLEDGTEKKNHTNLRADIEVTKTHLFNLISYLSIEFSEAEPSLPPKEYKKLSISTTSWVDLKKQEIQFQ